jgi:two-component system sensor histidine kinase DegS
MPALPSRSQSLKRAPLPIQAGVSPSRVAIIGAGKGGTALMEIFAEDPLVKIVGVAEIRPRTNGILLAHRLKIPVTRDYRDFLKMKHVDLVIDVTGNPDVELDLLKVQVPHLAIVGGASAKFMWQLIEARIRASTEIENTLKRYQSLFRLYVKEEAEGAVNDERTRIACEIHDGLVQTLVGVNLKMERCQELVPKDPVKCLDMLNQTTNQLKNAIQEARQVIYNLRPGQYDNLDLVSALSNYLKSYEAQYKIRTLFTPVVEDSRLEPKTKVFLFRMVQEALNNVTKHAKATRVKVQMTMKNGLMTTKVIDNGTGFDVQAESQNPEKWDHFGLGGMMERARMLSGKVRWESKKGQGTQVIIQVPVENKEKARHGQKNQGADRR